MGFKRNLTITIIVVSILLINLLFADQEGQSGEGNPVEIYSKQLEKISEGKDSERFEIIIVDFQQLEKIIDKNRKELKKDWEGYAASVGISLAKMIKNHWKDPGKIGFIGTYITTLGETLLRNDYQAAAGKIYNNIAEGLNKQLNDGFEIEIFKSNFDLKGDNLKPVKIEGKTKSEIEKNQRIALGKLKKLGNKISRENILSLLKNIEGLAKERKSLEEKLELLERKIADYEKDGFWKGLMKFFYSTAGGIFIITIVFLGILIVMVLFLFSLLDVRKRLKIKMDSIQDEEKQRNELRKWAEVTFVKKGAVEEDDMEVKVETRPGMGKPLEEKGISEITDKFKTERKELIDGFKELIGDIFQKAMELQKQGSFQPEGDKGTLTIDKQADLLSDKIIERIADAEREILEETWEGDKLKLIKEHFADLKDEAKTDQFFDRCYELESQLSFDEDLLYAYKNTVNSLRNYDNKLKKIRNIPKMVNNHPEKRLKAPTPAKDLQMIMKNITFLISLQNTGATSELIDFKVEKWVREEFWDFADQFFRTYQRKIFENQQAEEMEEAKATIVKILAEFKLEWIPITLGRTIFDSQIHVGRSYSQESTIPDHTISDIVRNGLREINGVVLQRPEVIVNRLHVINQQ
jgi:hypothetical protein